MSLKINLIKSPIITRPKKKGKKSRGQSKIEFWTPNCIRCDGYVQIIITRATWICSNNQKTVLIFTIWLPSQAYTYDANLQHDWRDDRLELDIYIHICNKNWEVDLTSVTHAVPRRRRWEVLTRSASMLLITKQQMAIYVYMVQQ